MQESTLQCQDSCRPIGCVGDQTIPCQGLPLPRHREDDDLGTRRRIGIDEFSYRRFHHYLTIVVGHDTRRVIWAGEGRSADFLALFFEEFGAERCAASE